jgi:hypothetical protein
VVFFLIDDVTRYQIHIGMRHQTVTAPGGNYYFNKVRPGQYVVRIHKIDYPLEVRETEMQDIPVITAPRH